GALREVRPPAARSPHAPDGWPPGGARAARGAPLAAPEGDRPHRRCHGGGPGRPLRRRRGRVRVQALGPAGPDSRDGVGRGLGGHSPLGRGWGSGAFEPAGLACLAMSTLASKLRLPAGRPAAVINPPEGYMEQLGPLASPGSPELDFVQLFVKDAAELRQLGPAAIRSVKTDGLLWVTYPKGGKTRGATDLPATPWWHRRDVLGEITGETGYVA